MTRIDCQTLAFSHMNTCFYASHTIEDGNYFMKEFKDYWNPKTPSNQTKARLMRSFVPVIEMKIVKDGIEAMVEFLAIDQGIDSKFTQQAKVTKRGPEGMHVEYPEEAKFKRIIQGPSEAVYNRAARVASQIGLSEERAFNVRWNRTQLNLLNKPSENKRMINLGTYKPREQSGLYDIRPPSELLSQKLISSKIPGATLAARAGVEESTLYRHLKGNKDVKGKGMDISREASLKYSKVLGCDPSELLFNPLHIPVWGSTDLQEMSGAGTYSVYPGEIIGSSKEEYTLCPREIYRPDVKSIRIDQENSFYNNYIAFYYNSNEPIVFEGQLVVVGVRLKNFKDDQVRFRYFFGIYKRNKNKKTVDILNPDPEALDIEGIEPDEDCHTFDDLKGLIEANRYVIDDIKPEFVAPVVALVNHKDIKEKENYNRDHNKYYNEARMLDLFSRDESKKFKIRNYLFNKEKEKIKDDVSTGSYKYPLSDYVINQKAEEKADQIFSQLKDWFYVDVLKNINKKLRPDITIKTDKGIKHLDIKKRDGNTLIKASREDLSPEEIDRINQIDDDLNDAAAYEPEDKTA